MPFLHHASTAPDRSRPAFRQRAPGIAALVGLAVAITLIAVAIVQAQDGADLYAPLAAQRRWLPWALLAAFVCGALLLLALVSGLRRTRGRLVDELTVRARTEAELRQADTRFRHAFEEAPIGIALVSLDGRFLRVNRALGAMLGRTVAETVGCTFQEITHPDDLDADLDMVAAILAGEIDSYQLEKRYLHPSGDSIDALLSVSLVRDEQARPLYFISQIEDVTERRNATRDADRLKQEFFALVSHELRTPLTSMVGYLEILLEDDVPDTEPAFFHQILHRNSLRLQRLVGDLLFVAQVEAGRLTLEKRDADLAEICRDAVTAAQPRAAEHEVALHCEIGGVPAINGDPERLGQVVDNLISNAIKFTPARGRVDITLDSDGEALTLAVRDTGVGIPDKELGMLFQRFFRASTATDAVIPGVGLGLSISKAIVEGHDGQIEVESKTGAGSCFTVTLPNRPSPLPSGPPAQSNLVTR